MQPNNSTAMVKQEPLAEYLARPEIIQKFSGLFPNDYAAKRHVESVVILVQTADPGEYSLRNCTNESILRSALRAASLRVSVDPAVRQAWLVPRRNKKNGNALEANLQLHYQEIINRVMRTGRYQTINVSPIYENQDVYENVYTGLHQIAMNGIMTLPNDRNALVKADERKGRVKGWLGYFRTFRGAEKTVYMTIAEIEKHAARYNPYWTSSKAWREAAETMQKKTVALRLLRQADMGDPAMAEISEILDEEEVIDSHFTDAEPVEDMGDYDPFASDPEPEQPADADPNADDFDPFAELRAKLPTDPNTAFFGLVRKCGLKIEEGQAILRELKGDKEAAFNKVAEQYKGAFVQ